MPTHIHIPFTQIRIGRFLLLLISFALMFILRPFLEDFIRIHYLMDIFITGIYLAAVYAVSQQRGIFLMALVMAFFTVALLWLTRLTDISALSIASSILGALFLTFTAFMFLSYFFRADKITGDMIMGVICVYFLIGLIWADVFFILEILQPGSFKMPPEQVGQATFGYYSYVTLTTLGYGDITPVSESARSLSLLEAVMGQLYIAVLIARLVGIHVAQSHDK
jgi:hypothetical protein